MSVPVEPHPYEKLVERFASKLSRVPYWLLWPAVGLVVYFVGEGVVITLRERDYPVMHLVFSAGLGIGPAILIFLAHDLASALGCGGGDGLAGVLVPPSIGGRTPSDQPVFSSWMADKQLHIFGVRTKKAAFFVFGIWVAGVATLFVSGAPVRYPPVAVAGVVLFGVLMALGAHAALTFLQLFRLLTDLGRCDVASGFSASRDIAFGALLGFYARLALMSMGGYAILALAIGQGPYGYSPWMVAWLTGLALIPLSISSWSFVQLHAVLRRAKQNDLMKADGLVEQAFDAANLASSSGDLQALSRALKVQARVQRSPEWPFDLGAVITLIASVAIGATQLFVAVAAAMKYL